MVLMVFNILTNSLKSFYCALVRPILECCLLGCLGLTSWYRQLENSCQLNRVLRKFLSFATINLKSLVHLKTINQYLIYLT